MGVYIIISQVPFIVIAVVYIINMCIKIFMLIMLTWKAIQLALINLFFLESGLTALYKGHASVLPCWLMNLTPAGFEFSARASQVSPVRISLHNTHH